MLIYPTWRPVIHSISLVVCTLLLASNCLAEQPAYQHGISLLHELKYPADFAHFEYVNPDAPKGGTLRQSTTSPIRNFSGAWGTGVSNASGVERIFDRLFLRSTDEPSAMYGLLADGVALSQDGKSLYIRLHKTARWHDGEPVTTRDIRFSYDVLAATSLGAFADMKSWVESFEIVNDQELVIHHRKAFTHNNLMSLTTFPVRPAHYYADRDPGKVTLEPPLSSGPYRIAETDRNFVIYERVEDYWGRDLPVNRGRHNFDRLRFDVYRDSTVARAAFRKGLLDVYPESDIRYWNESYNIPALEEGRIQKDTRTLKRVIGSDRVLTFNLEREMFKDVRVREALTLAFDFEWQNRVFRYDSQERALSYFAGSKLAATGLPDEDELALLTPYRDQIPVRVFTEPFLLPETNEADGHRAVLARAQALLREAGWTIVDGRLLNEDGEHFRMEIATSESSAKRLVLPYIKLLAVLGIDARLRLLDVVMAMRFKRERRFDMYYRGHDFSNPPMGGLEGSFGSAHAKFGMGGNLAGISNPAVDALIELAEGTTNMDIATTACRALDRVLLWGFYNIPLNTTDEERFLYWDTVRRPNDAIAVYEYLTVGLVRVIDTWWDAGSE